MNAMTRRWITGCSVAIVVATTAAVSGACDDRAELRAASFARRADHAARFCVRRGAVRGTICPDAHMTTRLARLRAATLRAFGRHCPTPPLEARLDALEERVLCHRLRICPTRLGSLRLAVTGDPDGVATNRSRRLVVDSGWTGIAHDLQILEGAGFVSELTGCGGGDAHCELFGRTTGTPLGAPSPISAGGVAVCVTVDFATDVIGRVDLLSGALTESARVEVGVYANGAMEEPCPACLPTEGAPRLGASGRCHAGPNVGGACVVGGLAGSEYGRYRGTSGDCPPAGAPIARFRSDVTATTGEVAVMAALPCVAPGESCWCPGQQRANGCVDKTCTPISGGGVCAEGPVDHRCLIQSFAGCIDDADCPAPGDRCAAVNRSCFPDPIRLEGTPDPPHDGIAHPTLVGAFCMASARNASVDGVAGYPGPTTFVWPAEVVFDQ